MEHPTDPTEIALAEERGRGRRLARSTAIFSLATFVSRVLGLVREMVSAYYFRSEERRVGKECRL